MKPPKNQIKTIADRNAIDAGCHWQTKEFQNFKKFASTFCIQSQGQWANQPIELFDYQEEDIFKPLLSWKNAKGNYRYRYGIFFTPKKTGKSTSISSLCGFKVSCYRDQKIYVIASKIEQARIIYDTIREFTRHPALKKRWHVRDHRNEIIDRETKSTIKVLSCNPSLSGISADLIVLDETAEWAPSVAQIIWDRLEFAMASKPNGQMISISTPAHQLNTLGHRLYQRAERLINGDTTDDITTMPLIYGLPMDADWTDIENYKKFLPHIDKTVPLDFYVDAIRKAKSDPHEELSTRIYLAGQYVQNHKAYIKLEDYLGCVGDVATPEQQPASIGLDFGGSHDICSWSVLVPIDDVIHVYPRAAITQSALERKMKVGKVEYAAWENAGLLKVSTNDTISNEQLKRWLEEDYEQFDIKALAYDPYHLSELQQDYEEDGRLVIETLPWGKFMGPLISDFEKKIRERKFVFPDNPMMKFCIENLRIKEDKWGRLVTDRESDSAKIDLAQSSIIALNSLPEALNPTPVWDLPPILSM